MKKGLAFLLALTLVFQLATPAFAETLPDETEGTTAVTETMETEPPATEAEPTEEPTVEAATETVAPTETTFAPTETTSATEEPSEETETTEPTYVLTEDSDVIASGTCGADGDNLTWVLTGDGTLTISGSGKIKGYSYSYRDGADRTTAPWGTYWKQIATVVMEPGVTSIGRDAFYGCSSLTSVTIPEGVTSIGGSAFSDCSSLTSVTIPDGVTSIGGYAFQGCRSLTSIEIPEGVTTIEGGTFLRCTSLESVVLPKGLLSIENTFSLYTPGDGAFTSCISLKNIVIPVGVTNIGAAAFSACSSLTSIEIPNSVTSIGEYAFSHCRELTSVTIPEGITKIAQGTFYACGRLKSVDLPNGLLSIEGAKYSWDYGAFAGTGLKNVIIPDGVVSIGSFAFSSCGGLTSVTIPDSVTNIGQSAFSICRSLTSVTIPESVTSIGYHTFYGCFSLTSVTIPDSVTRISDGAFSSCRSLTSVTIPESVTSIGDQAFADCSSLTSVTIPDSVTSIGKGTFSECRSLISIEIPNSVTSIGSYAFRRCSSLTSVTIPDSVTSIGEGTFSECRSLISIEIPNSVTSIGSYAFRRCSSLTSVTIPDSVTSIGEGTFSECRSLISIEIPNSVTSIGEGTFSECSSLTSVTIPEGVTKIERGTFYDCTSLVDIILPASLLSIEGESYLWSGAFENCTGLKSIIIPESVISIGKRVFCDSGLTSVTIPEGVTSIGDETFYGCRSLISVRIPVSVTSIDYEAFCVCSSLKNVYYVGNQEQWDSIKISSYGNEPLLNATLHLNYTGPILTSTSPADGETDVSLDSPLVLAFSHDIGEELDWSKGKICILDCDSQRSVLEVGADEFAQLGGYVEGNKLVIPSAFETDWIRFSTSGKLTLLIPDGLIYAVDADSGERVYYTGTRGDITFTVKRDIITTGFDLQKDAFRFSNAVEYFDTVNAFRPLDLVLLYNKASNGQKLLLTCVLGAKAAEELLEGFKGICYGMSSLMGLLQSKKLDISLIQDGATSASDLPKPRQNATLHSYLSYYNMVQILMDLDLSFGKTDAMQSTWGEELVSALKKGDNPVLVNLNTTGGAHAVLAYAIDVVSDPDNYVINIVDPNYLTNLSVVNSAPSLDKDGKPFRTISPVLLYLDKDTYRIKETYVFGSYQEELRRDPNTEYLQFTGITEMQRFDDYSIEDRDFKTGTWNYLKTTMLVTTAPSITILSDILHAEITGGSASGNMEVLGPFKNAYGNTNGELSTYYIEDCNTYTLKFDGSQRNSTYLKFANSDQAVMVDSDATEIVFSADGQISICGANDQSKLYVTMDDSTSDGFALSLTTNAADVTLTPQKDGSYLAESDDALGEVTVAKLIGPDESMEKTEEIQANRVAITANDNDQIKFIDDPSTITLDREYITINAGADSVQLQVIPSYVSEAIAWSAENPDGVQVIEVSKDGSVTPLNPGTAYVLATLNTDEKTLTARCRVDVTEKPANEEVLGVDLGLTKVTSELYSKNYASLDVLLRLKQNEISIFAEENQVTDNGVAITGAFLEDEAARQVFDLKVKDDRHLLLVPTQAAIDGAVPVSKKMTSRVVVEVNGVEYHTEDAVTVTVGKTLPKLKAQNVTFNSFYTDQSQALSITGGTVTKVENNGQWPDWLTLDGTKLTLNNAPAKGSASLNLLVSTEEWAVPVPVKVTAKLTCKAPAFRLSTSRVTIPVFTKPDDNGDTAGTVWVQLLCKRKGDTLEALNVVGIRAPEGWSTEAEWDSAADGWFALKPNPGTQVQAGKITLNVCFSDTKAAVPLTVSVKPQATPLTVSLYQPTVKYTLNSTVADGFFEPWYLGSRYMNNCQPTWSILDKAGQNVTGNFETYLADDGRIAVLTDPATVVPGNYRLCIDLERDGAIITEKTAVRNFTVLPATKKPSVALKAGAPMDISFPDPQTDVTFSRSNYFLNRFENYNELEDQAEFYDAKGNALQGCFQFARDEETNRWYIRPVSEVPAGSYQMKLNLILDSDSENGVVLCTVKFTVKRTPIKLKLSQSKLSLNKAVMDSAVVDVNCKTKGYTMGQPVITAPEEITAEYREGKLYLAVNEKTAYGTSYAVTVKAAENQPEAVLAVTIPAQAASNVTVSAKASGFIDVIRDSSEIVVTPSYKNYWGLTGIDKTARIFWAKDGKNFTEDVTAAFRLSWDESGRLHLQRAGNLELTGKYRLELAVQGAQKPALVNLTLKSGGAKVTAAPVVLYAKDANTRAELKFANQEAGLNPISRVEARSGEYTIENLSHGGFAIRPIPGKTLKSGKVSLNLFFEGNTTAKPNATVNLSVEIR